MIHEGLYHHFDGFPSTGHPMAILSAMINAMSCYEPGLMEMEAPATFQISAARLISKLRTIAAAAYKASIGQPIIYPKPHLDYCTNFLHMMFSIPFGDYEPDARDRSRPAADPDPARRPRAELLVQHRADGGLLRRQPVRQLRGRRVRSLGAAARRSQRRRRGDAPVPARQQRRPQGLHRQGQGQELLAHGSWGSVTGSTRATTPGPAS